MSQRTSKSDLNFSWKLCAILFLSNILESQQQGRHERLFPGNDEYDPIVLDASNMYGSPYGGFSRATRSRLASRPLKLPHEIIRDGDPPNETHYWEIADGLGRRFACRTFNEDEVEPTSLKDSLFDNPTFRLSVEMEDNRHNDLGERLARVVGSKNEYLRQAPEDTPEASEPPIKRFSGEMTEDVEKSMEDLVTEDFGELRVERRLDMLEGVCIQKRTHYWTYEWCWKGKVQQFHMKVLSKDPRHPRVQLERVTNLGYYSGRKIRITPEEMVPELDIDYEIGQAKEKFRHGDKCLDTDKSSKADVQMICCSESMTRSQPHSTTLIFGEPLDDITLASIASVFADPDEDCKYHINICTPLLCDATDAHDLDELLHEYLPEKIISNDGHTTTVKPNTNYEHLSVAEIIDQTLGDNCIYSQKNGWWYYEYCHKQYVRQFSGTEKYNGINLEDDTQYLLGYFTTKESDNWSASKEWEHIVNVTDDLGQVTHRGSSKRGGNGAYFEVEFAEGEICVLEDAKDEVSGAMERACSVRFSCGDDFSVTVREDTTCHYVAEVTIPPLCQHPLFKPLVRKKRSVKCLPVEEEYIG